MVAFFIVKSNISCSCRFEKVYDTLYNLCLAEDSIRPEKYIVEDYPPMNAFPAKHPNRALEPKAKVNDEL